MDKRKKKRIVVTGVIILCIILFIISLIKIRKHYENRSLLIYYYKLKLLIPTFEKYGDENFSKAIEKQDLETVERMLKLNYGLVNLGVSYSRTPLEVASSTGNERMVALLLAAGADSKKALHSAVEYGNNNLIPILLSTGMDVNTKDFEGNTPLHKAVSLGEYDCIESLLDNGADININNHNNETPLHLAVKQNWYSSYKRIMFQKNKQRIQVKPNFFLEITKKFIEKGARINSKNKDGKNSPSFSR